MFINRETPKYILDILSDPQFLLKLEQLIINYSGSSQDSKLKMLNTLNEIKLKTDLKKEIWKGSNRDVYWEPASGYIAFVDSKGIMRYKLVMTDFRELHVIVLKETYKIKRIISYEELTKKELFPEKFNRLDALCYEDENEAFKLTSKSVFPEYKFEHRYYETQSIEFSFCEHHKRFNTFLLEFEYDYHTIADRDYKCVVRGLLNLSTKKSFIIYSETNRH